MSSALPDALLIHTVTWIVPSTSTDTYGNTVRTYGSGTSISGRMEQTRAAENMTDGRDPLEQLWTLFTNTEGVAGYDRITFGTVTFEVEGPPIKTYGASGFHHLEANLRRVDG